MDNESLNRLPKEQFKKGTELALENARKHLIASENIIELGFSGMATSHLIFAVEELAKASMLRVKSIDNNIKINNLKEYFKKHAVKHEAISRVFGACCSIIQSIEVSEPEESKTEDSNEAVRLLCIILIIAAVIIIGMTWNNQEKKESIETLRQNGLYIGYDQETKEWKIPDIEIPFERYKTNRDIVKYMFEAIESSLFSDEKVHAENIKEFAQNLEDKNILAPGTTASISYM